MSDILNAHMSMKEWLKTNKPILDSHQIQTTEKFSPFEDNKQWKGTLEFVSDNILCTFTVWDKKPIETSLIVFSKKINKTLFFSDRSVENIHETKNLLNKYIKDLINKNYDNLEPGQLPQDYKYNSYDEVNEQAKS